MKARCSWLVVALAIVVLFAVVCVWLSCPKASAPTTSAIFSNPPDSNSVLGLQNAVIKPDPVDPLIANLLAACNSLKPGQDAATTKQQLAELRKTLTSADAAAAAAAIRRFLDSKVDATTGLGFHLGPEGSLATAPSLRVFLLDLLAEVDPKTAIVYSRQILETPGAPDEWAVALRNVARLDTAPDAHAFLEQKAEALLREESWVNNPSTGFLEAFDVAVHLGGITLLPPLTDLVQKQDNQAVAHAAFLALDRMVIREPVQVLEVLEQHPEMMAGREQTRANYFARADVGEIAQRQIVERYLLDSTRPASELQAFAGVFPNANYMISQNLLTENVTPDGATLARRDRDALRVVGEWLTDARFTQMRPMLVQIQQRLQGFVRQAESH